MHFLKFIFFSIFVSMLYSCGLFHHTSYYSTSLNINSCQSTFHSTTNEYLDYDFNFKINLIQQNKPEFQLPISKFINQIPFKCNDPKLGLLSESLYNNKNLYKIIFTVPNNEIQWSQFDTGLYNSSLYSLKAKNKNISFEPIFEIDQKKVFYFYESSANIDTHRLYVAIRDSNHSTFIGYIYHKEHFPDYEIWNLALLEMSSYQKSVLKDTTALIDTTAGQYNFFDSIQTQIQYKANNYNSLSKLELAKINRELSRLYFNIDKFPESKKWEEETRFEVKIDTSLTSKLPNKKFSSSCLDVFGGSLMNEKTRTVAINFVPNNSSHYFGLEKIIGRLFQIGFNYLVLPQIKMPIFDENLALNSQFYPHQNSPRLQKLIKWALKNGVKIIGYRSSPEYSNEIYFDILKNLESELYLKDSLANVIYLIPENSDNFNTNFFKHSLLKLVDSLSNHNFLQIDQLNLYPSYYQEIIQPFYLDFQTKCLDSLSIITSKSNNRKVFFLNKNLDIIKQKTHSFLKTNNIDTKYILHYYKKDFETYRFAATPISIRKVIDGFIFFDMELNEPLIQIDLNKNFKVIGEKIIN